jgi:hypothetical protein
MFTIMSMSEFEELYNDQVTLVGAEGAEIGPLRCIFNQSEGTITFYQEQFSFNPIKVFKVLPSGARSMFDVKDIQHHPVFIDRPARVILRVQKQGVQGPAGHINISGPVNISNSTGVQLGIGNTQDVVQNLVDIASLVQNGNAPTDQKAEALGYLQAFLRHPAVVAVIGGAATAAADRLIK